ncbi:hypothetical protein AG1IA_08920 [Rhizoctonia solani AG-1 IA]|uniref:Uncharacterized protein n=1 Tax=Thanatephorus cucumeris (strain AG1-IA) TaxID=983506 RepID=L8WFS9_THACA|nr:hypothetical protein AG1IA_08920 [Rhizoctonia solani AG-1 IA]
MPPGRVDTTSELNGSISSSSNMSCSYGRYRCSGLSNAARLGIGIGIAALTMLAFALIITMRRRRLQQANAAYIHNSNQAHFHPQPQYQQYPPQQYPTQPSYDQPVSFQIRYLGCAHFVQQNQWNNNNPYNNQQAPIGNYYPDNQSQQYAPPPGAPPSYAPPVHPPPTKEHVWGELVRCSANRSSDEVVNCFPDPDRS